MRKRIAHDQIWDSDYNERFESVFRMLTTASEEPQARTTISSDFPDIAAEISTGMLPEQFSANLGCSTRILVQTRNLVLLPSVSPLCVGHVLIFSKGEYLNFGEVQQSALSICDEVQTLVEDYVFRFGQPLFFEHGSTRGGQVACGVFRAHIHLLPRVKIDISSLRAAVERELGCALKSSFAALSDLTEEYIFLSEDLDHAHIWRGDGLPSQLLRRHIANQLCLESWNWRSLFGWQVMAQTIAEWTRAGRVYEPAN